MAKLFALCTHNTCSTAMQSRAVLPQPRHNGSDAISLCADGVSFATESCMLELFCHPSRQQTCLATVAQSMCGIGCLTALATICTACQGITGRFSRAYLQVVQSSQQGNPVPWFPLCAVGCIRLCHLQLHLSNSDNIAEQCERSCCHST